MLKHFVTIGLILAPSTGTLPFSGAPPSLPREKGEGGGEGGGGWGGRPIRAKGWRKGTSKGTARLDPDPWCPMVCQSRTAVTDLFTTHLLNETVQCSVQHNQYNQHSNR